MSTPSRTTRTIIERVFEALPADRIGEIYCEEGGEEFFEALRPRILADGFAWSEALAPRLQPLEGSKISFYVGAGIAELPALMTEVLDLGRTVVASNLREEECEILNRLLRNHGVLPKKLTFHPEDARTLAMSRDDKFSHVGIVSVLTDPETYPLLSSLTYARIPPVLIDVKAFERERAAARVLVGAVLARLAPRALITTTGEEVAWVLDWANRRPPEEPKVEIEVDDIELRAAVVGDPIGFLHVRTVGAGE